MAERGYYVHKRTGAKILLIESYPYLGEDTQWNSITKWRVYIAGAISKHMKESTIEKFYVRSENQAYR